MRFNEVFTQMLPELGGRTESGKKWARWYAEAFAGYADALISHKENNNYSIRFVQFALNDVRAFIKDNLDYFEGCCSIDTHPLGTPAAFQFGRAMGGKELFPGPELGNKHLQESLKLRLLPERKVVVNEYGEIDFE